MQKVFYLEPAVTPYEFMKAVRKEDVLSPYVFERASYRFEQTHCPAGAMSDLKRFYVFLADKHAVAPELIDKISANPAFSSFSVCASGSYEAYPEALASGFSNPFFLSRSEESANTLIDAMSSANVAQALVEPVLPEDSVEGSYLKPLAQGLSFSSDFSSLKSGRTPLGEEEICLSTSLAAKWNHPHLVYGAGLVASETVGDKIERDYRLFQLKVVGEVRSENDVLFAESYWAIDFWRDILGMKQESLGSVIDVILKAGKAYGQSPSKHKSVDVEYVSANPTGDLHLGHTRGAALGDAIANLYAKAGYDVTREYYVNNCGNQVEHLGHSLSLRYHELFDEKITLGDDDYHADIITDIETMGAALKFCAIAEGRAEISYRESPGTKEWDIAAGTIILKEAGGLILKHDGSEYTFNRTDVYNRQGYVLMNRKENFLL